MKELSLIDKSYNKEKRYSHFVSIQLNLNRFSFSVFDILLKKFIEYKSINIDFSLENTKESCTKFGELLKSEFDTTKQYEQIACLIETSKATLVPDALFSKDKKDTYFQFNHDTDKSESIYYDNLKNSENVNIYSFQKCLINSLQQFFPRIKIFHQSSVFMEEIFFRNKKKLINTKCFVLVNTDYFAILVLSPSKIILYNTFFYKEAGDFVYFILNTYEQLRLNPEIHAIEFYGNINKNSDIYFNLKKYIKNIKFANCENEFVISPDLVNIHSHNLLNHYFLFKCVS